MQRIHLGSTGIEIEKNGFGALPIQRISRDDAAYLHEVLPSGIGFFKERLNCLFVHFV